MSTTELTEEVWTTALWDLVSEIDFTRDKHEVEAEIAIETSVADLKRLHYAIDMLEEKMRKAAVQASNKPDWVSEDGLAETISAIIAKGKEAYQSILEDPKRFWSEEYDDWEDPCIHSYLPFREDYAKFTDSYYYDQCDRYAEEYEALATNDKYAEDFQAKAYVLARMLNSPVQSFAGRFHLSSLLNSLHDDELTYDADLMCEYADDLDREVPARYVNRLARDFRLYRQAYFNIVN